MLVIIILDPGLLAACTFSGAILGYLFHRYSFHAFIQHLPFSIRDQMRPVYTVASIWDSKYICKPHIIIVIIIIT